MIPRHAHRICSAALLLAAGALLTPAATGSATALELRVRGASKLYVEVRAAGTAAQIVGALRDELGQVLPQRTVYAEIRSADGRTTRETELITDMQGRFSFQEEFTPGAYLVDVRFRETEHLLGARFQQKLSLRRAPAALSIVAPALVTGERQAYARLRASVDGVGIQAQVRVRVNGRELATTDVDQYGRGAVDISAGLRDGENEVVVVLLPSGLRSGATARTTLRYSKSPKLDVSIKHAHQRLNRGVSVQGVVSDAEGGLSGGSVAVRFTRVGLGRRVTAADLKQLEGAPDGADAKDEKRPDGATSQGAKDTRKHSFKVTTTTDSRGRFNAFLPGHRAEDGAWRAEVVFRPEIGPALRAATGEVVLDRTSSRVMLDVLGLLAVLIGLGVLFHRLSTVDLRALLRRERDAEEPSLDDVPLTFGEEEALLVETLDEDTPTSDDQLGGVVWDTWRRAPIPHATILLRGPGDASIHLTADARGAFRSASLPPGAWDVRVEAPGFAPGTMQATLPHNGRLSHVRVGLIAIPYKVRRFYQDWVRRSQGADLWGRSTPREIEAVIWEAFDTEFAGAPERHDAARHDLASLLSRTLTAETLRDLNPETLVEMVTDVVEQSYWGGQTQDEAVWSLMVTLIQHLDALRAELAHDAPEAP